MFPANDKEDDKLNESNHMLIDFDDPPELVSGLENYVCKSPLIPCPDSSGSSGANNPFDVMVRAVENEMILRDPIEALMNGKSTFMASPVTGFQNDSFDLLPDLIAGPPEQEPVTDVSKIDEASPVSNGSHCVEMDSSDVLSPGLGRIDSEIDLKNIIAQRVSSCIQRALNSSQSHSDLRAAGNPRTVYTRSMSEANIKRDKLPQPNQDNSPVFNNNLSRSQSLKTDFSPQKDIVLIDQNKRFKDAVSTLESKGSMVPLVDKIMSSSDLEHVFKEAKKLSRTFSNLSQRSFHQSVSEQEVDDIMLIEPRWDDDLDSSEEEDEAGLPSLKLYHVRHSKSPTHNLNSSDSEALTRFKNRHRASLNLSLSDIKDGGKEPDKEALRRTTSDSSLLNVSSHEVKAGDKEPQCTKRLGQAVILPSEVIDVKLRSKKPAVSELPKKGPMKAMMPLQKMTRKLAEKISSPLKTYQKSPLYSKKSESAKKLSTTKDNSFLSSVPVAASTPNKQNGQTTHNVRTVESNTTPKLRLSRRDSASRNDYKRSSSASSKRMSNSGSMLNTTPSLVKSHSEHNASDKTKDSKPKSAPSPPVNPRALTDIQKSHSNPQSNLKKPFGKLMSKLRRSGSLTEREKENRVA